MHKRTGLDFDMRSGRPMVEDDYKEPDTWTIITALNRVLDQAQDSELSDEFWASVKNPLAYLRGVLGLSDIQIVVMAMMIESGEPLSWKKMGNFLNCSRLMMMTFSEEIEEMKLDLIERLKIYKAYKDICSDLKELEHDAEDVFYKLPEEIPDLVSPVVWEEAEVSLLLDAYRKVL